jgi:hypothetical protein
MKEHNPGDKTATLPGKSFGAHKVDAADDFAYQIQSTARMRQIRA